MSSRKFKFRVSAALRRNAKVDASEPRFNVSAQTRHPTLGSAYDPKAHRYTDSYLNPGKYVIRADAFPGLKLVRVIPAEPDGSTQELKIVRLQVPADTVAFDFTVTRIGASFTRRVSQPVTTITGTEQSITATQPWSWRAEVPGEGTYELTVQLRNRAGGGPQATRRITLRDFLIVSIGDSSASGQGNPDIPGTPKVFEADIKWWEVFVPALLLYEIGKAAYENFKQKFKQSFTTIARAANLKLEMEPPPTWLEPKAYRSLRSGPALAAQRLENPRAGRMVTFLSFARTGSDIENGLLGPRRTDGKSDDGWIGNIGQVREIVNTLGNRRIDALLISIGVNDIGVSGTLTDLVQNDSRFIGDGNGDNTAARDKARAAALARLEQLPGKFSALAAAIRALNVRHVYLIEYPTGLFDNAKGEAAKGCEIFSSDYFDLNLDLQDARLVKDLADRLNQALRREAQAGGRKWFFIDGIDTGFRGHGYCTSDKVRFFVKAEESLIMQGDTEGTIHPNAAGHAVYAERIAAMVKANTLDRPDLDKIITRGTAKRTGDKVKAVARR